MDEWIMDKPKVPGVETEHLNGIPWYNATIPHRFHRCKPQTKGWLNWLTRIQRCSCGAINMGHGWAEKNSRRKK